MASMYLHEIYFGLQGGSQTGESGSLHMLVVEPIARHTGNLKSPIRTALNANPRRRFGMISCSRLVTFRGKEMMMFQLSGSIPLAKTL